MRPCPRERGSTGSTHDSFAVRRVDVVLEATVSTFEREPDLADLAVTMLGEVDLGDALLRRLAVVDLVAVYEQDHVSVLLDGARFTQVGHHRFLVLALLDAAIQLRQRDHRAAELLRERLQAAR